MNVFGTPVAVHGPRKIDIIVFALLAVGAFWLAWLALQQEGSDKVAGQYEAGICVAVGLPLLAIALWNSRLRVALYPEGISYSNFFGEKQIRWDDLASFYYQAAKNSINFIPIGTSYWFRLIDSQGQKIRFGSGLNKSAALSSELLELTQGPLLRRIATQFDSGVDVHFGPMRLSRQGGIVIRNSWGRLIRIPWDKVHSYAIQSGHFYIWQVGKRFPIGHAIAKVPNAFALLGLLNIIFKSSDSAAVS